MVAPPNYAKTNIQRPINELVVDLYEPTEDEIKFVER